MKSVNLFLLVLLLHLPATALAADLTPRTLEAYRRYVSDVEARFWTDAKRNAVLIELQPSERERLLQGEILAGPGHNDGIMNAPDGLIHHWRATAFFPGVTLADVLAVVQNYSAYSAVYEYVVGSDLLAHEGDRYRVRLRLKRSVGPITGVLDVWTVVEYRSAGPGRAVAVSDSDSIRQVENAGTPREKVLPAGVGSGYLWGATTFSKYLERDDGVYVELDTLGLSRRFPPLLGWIIEPIARRLGRGSAADSLRQLRTAMER